jgi:hypothetical protein
MTGALIASTLLAAKGSIDAGKAQSRAYEAQAKQAENDARTQTIERKRALIETLAEQNVGAASSGRTIGSISHLQEEDVRRAGYDETMIKGGASAKATAARNAGASAKSAGYTKAASSLLGGYYQHKKAG